MLFFVILLHFFLFFVMDLLSHKIVRNKVHQKHHLFTCRVLANFDIFIHISEFFERRDISGKRKNILSKDLRKIMKNCLLQVCLDMRSLHISQWLGYKWFMENCPYKSVKHDSTVIILGLLECRTCLFHMLTLVVVMTTPVFFYADLLLVVGDNTCIRIEWMLDVTSPSV